MIYVVNSDRRSRVDAMLWGGQSAPGGRPFLTGRDFLDELSHLPPGVVIIDVENAGMNGFDLIEAAVTARFECPVIAVLAEPDMNAAVLCLRRGAADVVVRSDSAEALREAVAKAESVLELRRPLSEQFDRDKAALDRLNARELEVLSAMAHGAASKSIAEQLRLSVRTVEAYRGLLLQKLGCGTAAGAIALSVRHDTLRQARYFFAGRNTVQGSAPA